MTNSYELNTASGVIKIADLSDDMLKGIQSYMTYGFMPLGQEVNGAKYGYVVKCGEDEIPCLKQQPADYPKETAIKILNIHQMLILKTYCKLAHQNLDMLYFATPYLRQKHDNLFEPGVAHFIFPSENHPSTNGLSVYDWKLGDGATELFINFVDEFKSNFTESFNIPYIGVDIRTRSQLGSILSSFMLYKTTIVYLGTNIQDNDPRFEMLAKNGIKEVVHAPALPMEITKEQLKEAKP